MRGGKGIHVRYVPGTYRPLANRDNDYLIDRAAQKAGRTFSGVEGIAISGLQWQLSGNNGPNTWSFRTWTTITFATATVIERHLGTRLALPTILIASYVGTSRLHDNVHFLSDVVFGAAVGTAAGWTVVGRHGRTNYTMAPTPVPGGMAFMVTRTPR